MFFIVLVEITEDGVYKRKIWGRERLEKLPGKQGMRGKFSADKEYLREDRAEVPEPGDRFECRRVSRRRGVKRLRGGLKKEHRGESFPATLVFKKCSGALGSRSVCRNGWG